MARIAALAREPLVHFLAAGIVLYGVSVVVAPSQDQSRILDLGPTVQSELITTFAAARGRRPDAAELDQLIDTWVLNEVLFRYGRALGLDRGDEMIRERVIQKARVAIYGGIVVPEPTAAQVEAYFTDHRQRYDQEARFDFVRMYVPDGEAAARQNAAEVERALSEGRDPPEAPAQPMVPFDDRPRASLVTAFGEPFVVALEHLPVGHWEAVESAQGWNLVRLFERRPGRPAALDEVRPMVVNDWRQAELQWLARASVADMQAQFQLVRPAVDPAELVSDAQLRRAIDAGNRDGATAPDGS